MGQAKQRLLEGKMPYQQVDYKGTQKEQIVAAVESILVEARSHVNDLSSVEEGRNCVVHAIVVEKLLKPLLPEMEVRSAIGYANWCVHAKHPGGVIGHNPNNTGYIEELIGKDGIGFSGHAWVVINEKYIVDITSNTWQHKLDVLAQCDGLAVTATWKADYLVLDIAKETKSWHAISFDYSHGAYYDEQKQLNYILDITRYGCN